MGSDITNALGMPKRDKRSQAQKDEIAAANAMKPVDFSTPHGSQGVTNQNYAEYVKMHPDLMANYNANWSGKGVSLAEFGAMHWNSAGRNEGRTMPGVSGGGGEEAGYGGGLSGPLGGWFSPDNIYFPQLVQEYERPAAQDWGASLSGPLGDPLLYQPWTSDYRSKYGGIMEYQPPRLNVGPPRFSPNVTGFLDFGEPGIPEGWLEYLGPPEEPEKKTEFEGGEK